MMYPLYAKNLATGKDESQSPIMALPCQETIQEIARNLCIDTPVIDRIVRCLCQSGMLSMLNPSHFTIPNYERFCQFAEFVREEMGYTAHLQTERKVSFRSYETETAISFGPPDHPFAAKHEEAAPLPSQAVEGGDDPKAMHDSFQTLIKSLKHEVTRGTAELVPIPQ
jgi:hypothetical protein